MKAQVNLKRSQIHWKSALGRFGFILNNPSFFQTQVPLIITMEEICFPLKSN